MVDKLVIECLLLALLNTLQCLKHLPEGEYKGHERNLQQIHGQLQLKVLHQKGVLLYCLHFRRDDNANYADGQKTREANGHKKVEDVP